MFAIKHAEVINGEAKVTWVHCFPEMLTEEDLESSIQFENLPEMKFVGGKNPELYIAVDTNTLFYKYVDVPVLDMDAINQQIKELQVAINTLLGI